MMCLTLISILLKGFTMSTAVLLGLSLVVIGDSHLADPSYLMGTMHTIS